MADQRREQEGPDGIRSRYRGALRHERTDALVREEIQ
jgi:hypothetical protein